MGAESLLLVCSEEPIVKDVSFAASMLQLPVVVARTFGEVERSIGEADVRLVLARPTIKGIDRLIFELHEFMKNEASQAARAPIALLCKETEESLVEQGHVAQCVGVLRLPVEFPAFVHSLQALWSQAIVARVEMRGTLVKKEPEDDFDRPAATGSGSDWGGGEADSVEPEASRELKLQLLRNLQEAVIEMIQGGSIIDRTPLDELPRLLMKVTSVVCSSQ